jgi:enamine deaminase RidA (YjgF/YER057c/UK114 family)
LRSVRFGSETHHFLAVQAPLRDAAIDAQLDDLLDKALERLTHADPSTVVRLSLYVPAGALPATDKSVARAFGARRPAVELFAQPPWPNGVAAMAWCVTKTDVQVDAFSASAKVDGPSGLTALGHLSGESARPTDFGAALESIATRLRRLNLSFSDVVKTWTCFPAADSAAAAAGFQGFNALRARRFASLDFARYETEDGQRRYPANTGVGVYEHWDLVSGVAAAGRARLVPLENPLQTAAFEYPRERIAKPALFSRGMAVVLDGQALVFVSGTGSVVGAQTVHPGDAARQSEQVLRNIDRLLEPENLQSSGVATQEGGLRTLTCMVAFASTAEASAAVAAACERALPRSIPLLILRAPLFRPDMLVEMEAIAFVRAAEGEG